MSGWVGWGGELVALRSQTRMCDADRDAVRDGATDRPIQLYHPSSKHTRAWILYSPPSNRIVVTAKKLSLTVVVAWCMDNK